MSQQGLIWRGPGAGRINLGNMSCEKKTSRAQAGIDGRIANVKPDERVCRKL
jgi:hypothetical protein